MDSPIVLVVRFRVQAASRTALVKKLREVFEIMQHEHTFLNATIHEDVEDPEQLLVYETWQETRESFLANQMPKSYRGAFEHAIVDLKVERTPQWLKPVAAFK